MQPSVCRFPLGLSIQRAAPSVKWGEAGGGVTWQTCCEGKVTVHHPPPSHPRELERSPDPLLQEKVIKFLVPALVLAHGLVAQCRTLSHPELATEDQLWEPSRTQPAGASAAVPPATGSLRSGDSPAEHVEVAPSLTEKGGNAPSTRTQGLSHLPRAPTGTAGLENTRKTPVELAWVIPRMHCLVPKKQRSNEDLCALPPPLYTHGAAP